MTSTQRVWISSHAYERLEQELTLLKQLLAEQATEGDAGENAAAVQRARQVRIQQIHDLMVNATVGEDPPDDGVAEPGMVVTVRFDDAGEIETFLLGLRGTEYGDVEVYSIHSPLGAAILGARVGQRCTYATPGGSAVTVTLLKAVPYGIHTATAELSER
jgi:transcription elongation GreA/GreB family factor